MTQPSNNISVDFQQPKVVLTQRTWESDSSKPLSEAPPKNSDERVERLLAKLESASHMTDMEE